MNETPMEPEGLDDPALLAEIEAEFAELSAEIQRISAMPSSAGMGPQKRELIEALRASWRERLTAKHGDRPEWRKKLDETIGKAVDRLLEDGIIENADGSLGFALRGDTLKNEGGPLLRGLLDGLSHMLSERFPATPAPAAPGQGAAQTPANPLQGLLGGLGQMLAGALKSAVSQVGAQAGPVTTSLPTGGGGNVKVVVKPASDTPGDGIVKPGEAIDAGTVEFQGEQQIAASFEIDTRQPPSAADAPSASDPSASQGEAPPAAAPNAAPNVFFQQLFAGLGQAMRQALTPAAPPPPPAAAPPAAPTDGATPTAPGSPDAPPSAPTPPPQAPQAASPFAGLGQLVLGAIQKAFTPPSPDAAPPPAPSPEAASTPSPSAETSPEAPAEATPEPALEPEQVTAEALTVKIPAANLGAPPADGANAPSLNVDLAGLLKQLLGGVKPPS